MTKVSSGKPKKGPPAHANSYAFHHNKSSKLTKHITSLPIRFLCPACVAVIEWRKKYRKYKPLTVVKRCTVCGEKRIKDAYHVICGGCVRDLKKCGKCLLHESVWVSEEEGVEINEAGEVIQGTKRVSTVADVADAADTAEDIDAEDTDDDTDDTEDSEDIEEDDSCDSCTD